MTPFTDTFADIDSTLMGVLGDAASLDLTGDGVTLVAAMGLFDAPWLKPSIGTLRTELLEPMFVVDRSVDLSGVIEGTSQLTVAASVYTVVDLQPDSTGLTTLVLRPVA